MIILNLDVYVTIVAGLSSEINTSDTIKYYFLVGGKEDKHMVGNMGLLITIKGGQYSRLCGVIQDT